MTLKTSLLITGDSTVAQKAVDDLKRGLTGADASFRAVQGSARETAGAVEQAAAKFRQHSKAINDNHADMARHAAGVRNLGQQFGDLSVMIGGGIDPMRAFATQAGQMGYALSEMNGKAGAVGAFLTGPWGIALTVGVTMLAPFVEKLFEAADAAGEVESATDGMSVAQKALSSVFDTTTGKLLKQNAALSAANELMRINARIAAINLRSDAVREKASSLQTFQNAGSVSVADRLKAALTQPGDLVDAFRGLSNGTTRGAQNARNLAGLVASIQAGRVRAEDALRSSPKLDFTGTKITREDFQKALRDMVSSALKERAADLADQALDTGVLPAEFRRTASAQRSPRLQSERRASEARPDRTRAVELAAEAKAAMAVQRANDMLDASLSRVVGRYDPAADAAQNYRRELEEIAKLSSAGRLTPEQALDYGQRAGAVMRRQTAQAQLTALGLTPDQVDEDVARLGTLINGVASQYGQRLTEGSRQAGEELASVIGAVAGTFGVNLGGAINTIQRTGQVRTETADTVAGALKKIGIGDKTASDIGRGAGKALAGAMEGQMAAGVAGMLGIKTSNTGAAIGGAVGSISKLFGPAGSIIGGVLGGVLGGLFGSKTAPNASAIFSNSDTAKVGGSSDEMRASLKGSASSITTGLKQIAEQLGGSLGAFTVSIGKYDDYYRVSSTETKTVGEKGYSPARVPGLIYDGKDEAAAIAAALVDAIKDGAIKGVSPAVSAALKSTSDINDAVKEASGVQQLELLIGGPAAQIKKALSDFEKVAGERVRMAKSYGLDLLATDKANAAERLKLNEQLVAAQVGSLKALVQELTSGSLFEGTAMDKIAALNTSIAKAKADLDAGVEGSADTLARLYEQRLTASKDAYGTTSAYAADRQSTIAEAQAAIARVNAQVTAAQAKGSDPALATTNSTLDEISDQTARVIAAIEGLPAQLASGGGRNETRFDLTRLARA